MISYSDIFENAVNSFNNNNAIIKYNNGSYDVYTYNQLQEASQTLYNKISVNFKEGEIVGIFSTHSVILPAIINIIHKCNCGFMFFDLNLNETSIKQVISDMKVRKIFIIDKEIKLCEFSCVDLSNFTIKFNCKLYMWIENIERTTEIETKFQNELAYLIKTSGSTGVSKNVFVSHNSILSNVNDFKAIFKVSPSDIIYFSTPLTFDPSMIELYLAAENGAALMIAPPLTKVLFGKGNDSKYNITIWQTTPSLFMMLGMNEVKDNVLNKTSPLRILALGGEHLTFDIFGIKSRQNQTEIYNLYGITEVSCWASVKRMNRLEDYMTENGLCIGDTLTETSIQIWNDSNKRVIDEVGNIFIGSNSRICLVGEESSYHTFKSLKKESNLIWRNTGDLGKEVDGCIYFKGRSDRLVKRFGHKVNILEIESVAFKFKGIDQCFCFWRETNSMLILFYISNENIKHSFWKYLSENLNAYSMPDDLIKVDALPMNNHGKISLYKTEELYKNLIENRINTLNDKHILLTMINRYISNVLNFEDIKNKSFINLGGTSIAAVQMTNQLENNYNTTFPELYTYLLDVECPLVTVLDFLKSFSILNHTENKSIKRNLNTIELPVESLKKQCHAKTKLNFELVWSFNTGKCVDAKTIFYTNKSGQGYVLIGSHSGIAVILNSCSGQPHFSQNLQSRIEAPFYCFANDFGPSAVVGCYNGSFWCVSIENSRIQWQISLESMIKSQACHYESKIFVASYDSNLHTICMNTGKLMSSIKISTKGIAADLLCHESYIFVATLDGICSCVEVANDNHTILWKNKVESPVFAKPCLLKRGEFVLFCEVNRKIHCFNSKSGDNILSAELRLNVKDVG
ncbi:aminoadipate-semialdehyde dehydrogenase isoform X2 [Arctopsyche grandis]|uniref:aminoadipate-semialdehyde dehydrogenase isoform X2 n=1 Tax=Arctopsyche grandis TaxID=121162 RepID=UPI00406D698F